jgi:DNA polymerase III delta subunit
VKPGKSPAVTAITGEEHVLRRREITRVISHLKGKGWVVEAADGLVPGSLDDALTPDPFAAKGEVSSIVVLVSNPEKLHIDVLNGYVEDPPADVALVLDYDGTPKGNTKFGKFCEALGKNHRSFEKPKPYLAAERSRDFLVAEVTARGLTLNPKLADAIVTSCGTDLGVLTFEALKLCTLAEAEGAKEVTIEHAKGATARLAAGRIDSIKDALLTRNRISVARALTRVKESHGKDMTMPVTRFLQKDVLTWVAVADMTSRNVSPDDIAVELSLHPWFLKNKIVPGLRAWTLPDLVRIPAALAAGERAVLSGALRPWTVFSAALLELCR